MSDTGRYRRLYVRLWRHPGFVTLTADEYLLTGPQTNRIGIYTLSIAQARRTWERFPKPS